MLIKKIQKKIVHIRNLAKKLKKIIKILINKNPTKINILVGFNF
jgi:hypothetical protein